MLVVHLSPISGNSARYLPRFPTSRPRFAFLGVSSLATGWVLWRHCQKFNVSTLKTLQFSKMPSVGASGARSMLQQFLISFNSNYPGPPAARSWQSWRLSHYSSIHPFVFEKAFCGACSVMVVMYRWGLDGRLNQFHRR